MKSKPQNSFFQTLFGNGCTSSQIDVGVEPIDDVSFLFDSSPEDRSHFSHASYVTSNANSHGLSAVTQSLNQRGLQAEYERAYFHAEDRNLHSQADVFHGKGGDQKRDG